MSGPWSLLLLAPFLMIHSGCHQTPAETSFGVEGTVFDCFDDECDISFIVDNQMPHSVKIEYRAVLSNAQRGDIFELAEQLDLPALETTKVSRTVHVTDRPDRLRVTVTTLQGH